MQKCQMYCLSAYSVNKTKVKKSLALLCLNFYTLIELDSFLKSLLIFYLHGEHSFAVISCSFKCWGISICYFKIPSG